MKIAQEIADIVYDSIEDSHQPHEVREMVEEEVGYEVQRNFTSEDAFKIMERSEYDAGTEKYKLNEFVNEGVFQGAMRVLVSEVIEILREDYDVEVQ